MTSFDYNYQNSSGSCISELARNYFWPLINKNHHRICELIFLVSLISLVSLRPIVWPRTAAKCTREQKTRITLRSPIINLFWGVVISSAVFVGDLSDVTWNIQYSYMRVFRRTRASVIRDSPRCGRTHGQTSHGMVGQKCFPLWSSDHGFLGKPRKIKARKNVID